MQQREADFESKLIHIQQENNRVNIQKENECLNSYKNLEIQLEDESNKLESALDYVEHIKSEHQKVIIKMKRKIESQKQENLNLTTENQRCIQEYTAFQTHAEKKVS